MTDLESLLHDELAGASPRPAFAAELEQRIFASATPLAVSRRRFLAQWPAKVAIAAGVATVVAGGAGVLLPRLTPEADAKEIVAKAQDASEPVPTGKVRHVTTTYTISSSLPQPSKGPSLNGTRTIEQWFGSGGVIRQTGMLGETIVIDSSGTQWSTLPDGLTVVKIAKSPKFPVPAAPNKFALDQLDASGQQAKLAGHTTVNGRAATLVQLTKPLPTASTLTTSSPPPPAEANAVFLKPGPDKAGFIRLEANSTGMLIIGDGTGGSAITALTVDDQTHQILKGQTTSTNGAGQVIGQTHWELDRDELVDASSLPADFFTFKVPTGATVQEPKPGEPFSIQLKKP